MAGNDRRGSTALGQPSAVSGHSGHQHHRLGVGGQGQSLFRAFVDQVGHVFAQCVRGFFQGFAHGGMIAPSVEHTDRLRALTWKNKRKCGHGVVLEK